MSFYELNQELTERLNNKFNETTKKLTEKGAEIDILEDMSQKVGDKEIKGKAVYVKYQGGKADVFIGIDREGNLHFQVFNDCDGIIKQLIDDIIK